MSLTCVSFINSVPNTRHRDDLGHHWQPRLISHSVSTVPPQAVCTPYYSPSSVVTSESASISANFIAFGFDCIGWQYDSQKNWTEYEIRDEYFFLPIKEKDNTIWISLCVFFCACVCFQTSCTTVCSLTSSSSSSTSSACMSSADGSISLLGHRESSIREAGWIKILIQFLNRMVLHSVLEDIGVQMSRTGDICGEK